MTTTSTQLPALEYLMSIDNWVLWKYEDRENSKTKETGTTKVLYWAQSPGRPSSSTDPTKWTSYKVACEAYARNSDRFDGIGFCFNGKVTLLMGIDLDKCINEHGIIDEWALKILRRVNSYAEFSPSTIGIHIFVLAAMPNDHAGRKFHLKDKRHEKAAVELYDSGRFFTYTGNHVPGTPDTINEAQDEVDALIKELDEEKAKRNKSMVKASNNMQAQKQERVPLEDENLLDKARRAKNRDKFISLFDNGDCTPYGGDCSGADEALCDLLAFWTGKDGDQMDRLFRQSALMRQKWDDMHGSQTYGVMTINCAIRDCTTIYTGAKDSLPEIILVGQLRDQMEACLDAMKKRNEKDLSLFVHLSFPSKVATDETDKPFIMRLGRAELRNELTVAANFFIQRQYKGVPYTVSTLPPKDIADQLLGLEPSAWPVPALRALVGTPVLRPDGTILDTPGYDQDTKLYYLPSEDMARCKVPTNPTRADAIKAFEFLKPIFADFPFEGDADYANALGAFITHFIRHAIKGDVQVGLIDATNPGTGKGLLASIIALVATGSKPSLMSAKGNDENEWRKSILTALLPSPRVIVVDNIRGVLESATLELVLTSSEGGFSERILGQSRSAKVMNEATWLATGAPS